MQRLVGPHWGRLVKYTCATALIVGCSAGTLSSEEKSEFRSELDRLFSEDAGSPSPGTTDDDAPQPPTPSEPSESDEPPSPSPSPSSPSPSSPSPSSPSPSSPSPSSPSPSSPSPSNPSSFFDDCVLEVFETSCAGIACHYGGVFPPKLDDDDLFDLLTTVRPLCTDAGANYVDLDTPDRSFILQKLRGEQPSTCGTVMPPESETPLSDAQLQCMEDWFASL